MSTTGLSQKSQDLKNMLNKDRKSTMNATGNRVAGGSKTSVLTDKEIEDF